MSTRNREQLGGSIPVMKVHGVHATRITTILALSSEVGHGPLLLLEASSIHHTRSAVFSGKALTPLIYILLLAYPTDAFHTYYVRATRCFTVTLTVELWEREIE